MDKLSEEQKQRLAETGQAAVNMSHGIKNILQSIRSGRDVMDQALDRGNMDVARRTWTILRQNLDRIETLSLNMLKFSKDQELHPVLCDFNILIEDVVKMIQPQADDRHIKIIAQLDEHLEPVSVDPEQIQDVIMNLLINALEAVPSETSRIEVCTGSDKANQQVILSVSDNGPGIEDTSVIFEPFHSTKENVGTGLGLTIAQKIIATHHGSIDVQSKPGQGATFTVRLPQEQNQENKSKSKD